MKSLIFDEILAQKFTNEFPWTIRIWVTEPKAQIGKRKENWIKTKGTIIEVNVSDLGLVTSTGKVVWGKYAQVTNNPENDGCINGVLLV